MKNKNSLTEKSPFIKDVIPAYYTDALRHSYSILVVYFVCCMLCLVAFRLPKSWLAILPWFIMASAARYCISRIPIRWSLLVYTTIIIGWMTFFIYNYGWNCGASTFMLPLMVICMFSLYDSLKNKLVFAATLFALRMLLFFYCETNLPVYDLTHKQTMILQTVNTILVFISMTVICLTFSNNIQKTEKHLMLYNRELQQQAATDPLTTLYNRRRMEEILENHIMAKSDQNFCIAIGDIDLFKQINDTYGHNCGDKVLESLSALFVKKTLGLGHVCRWGGEEFLFFLPDMNLDEASALMNEINISVSSFPIEYKGQTHHVTMTFGVEEYDYHSKLHELVKRADDKLYYGKSHGRNKVVF